MKIALVSLCDFAYPGGVCQYNSCLEQHFTRMGHEVKSTAQRVLNYYLSVLNRPWRKEGSSKTEAILV